MSEKKHIFGKETHVGIGTGQGEAESMIKHAEEEPDLAVGKHGVAQGGTSGRPTEYAIDIDIDSLHKKPDLDEGDVKAGDTEVSGYALLE